jgi:hypothetical protein
MLDLAKLWRTPKQHVVYIGALALLCSSTSKAGTIKKMRHIHASLNDQRFNAYDDPGKRKEFIIVATERGTEAEGVANEKLTIR